MGFDAALKFCLFALVCIYASIVDIKTHTVPRHISVLLMLIGLLRFQPAALWGFAVIFIPMFFLGWLTNGYGYGDTIFCSCAGFVLQGYAGMLGVAVSCLLGLSIVPAFRLICHQSVNTEIPLVPVFSAGFLLTWFILLHLK